MQRRTAKRDSLAGKPSAGEAGLQRDRTAERDCRGDLPTCTCMGQYVTHKRDKHRVLCHSAAGVQGGGESEEVGAGGGAGLTSNRRRRNKDVVDVAAAAVIMMIGCGVAKCAARQWSG
jgi:hypothetical protein